MIAARDTRKMNLYTPDEGLSGPAITIERSLRGYYAAKVNETPDSSVFRQFLEQERKLRAFGGPLNDRLADVPVPDAIARLSDGEAATLNDPYFAHQVRNLYDCVAANDLLNMRVASLEYLNFDTHDHQNEELTANFTDLFGHNKGLHALYDSLPADARQNMVMVLAGEFGRQIRANLSGGTDHGKGTIMLVIGESVRGGIYGDMFPASELEILDNASPQTAGLTAFEHAFAAVCEKIEPGSGDIVFPDRYQYPIENGVDLTRLFT